MKKESVISQSERYQIYSIFYIIFAFSPTVQKLKWTGCQKIVLIYDPQLSTMIFNKDIQHYMSSPQ